MIVHNIIALFLAELNWDQSQDQDLDRGDERIHYYFHWQLLKDI
jgi:hypothetical protein